MGQWSLNSYTYELPKGLIAQEPVSPRDKCRLLVLDRSQLIIKEKIFSDLITFLQKGDVLVLNDTKVIRARIKGKKKGAGKVEILLLKEVDQGVWEVLAKPAKRVREKDSIIFKEGELEAEVIGKTKKGSRILRFYPADLEKFLPQIGETPLPPYIKKTNAKLEDYQTVYAKHKGAVAAPTAGLHFTSQLLDRLTKKGVKILYITLHCGLATFRPVKTPDIREHDIETEYIEISPRVAEAVNSAMKRGNRIIAVGTTAVRSLESAAIKGPGQNFMIRPYCGDTNLYIVPGYKFKIVDGIITNFHTPCSTNLILISSFAPLDFVRASYTYAKDKGYRFYSFGDAMFIA